MTRAERRVLPLYRAVQKYVEANGGNVVVAGGIQIQTWPGDGPHRFSVAVKCTGNKPAYAESQQQRTKPRKRK